MEEEKKEEDKTPEVQSSKTQPPVIKYMTIALGVLLIAGAAFYIGRKTSYPLASGVMNDERFEGQRPPQGNKQGGSMPSLVGQKFSDTQLFANAYLIAPGDLSVDAKAATDGFDIQKQNMDDGSIQVTLVPVESNPNYKQQSYTVKPGYKLYFVELSRGDDQPGNVDSNLRDDFGVLVDETGTVVQ